VCLCVWEMNFSAVTEEELEHEWEWIELTMSRTHCIAKATIVRVSFSSLNANSLLYKSRWTVARSFIRICIVYILQLLISKD